MNDPYWKIFLPKRHCPLYALAYLLRADPPRRTKSIASLLFSISPSAAADDSISKQPDFLVVSALITIPNA
ncbi:hypothetical protein [Echinicola rosea]|uniref:hypothetical protein n=1 Tax=Echinicola rosea TaxID=1807691 RepID=UPI0010CA7AA7|nr:hypothetical protein [Echinicola rosea]